jgi:hypothetical protein
MRLYLVSLLSLALIGGVGDAQDTRARRDTLPPFSWAALYFEDFDAAVRVAGLQPLRHVRARDGRREVRIWTGIAIGIPKEFYRFVEESGRVTGEMLFYWPGPVADDSSTGLRNDVVSNRVPEVWDPYCRRFASRRGTAVCWTRFTSPPDFGSVLRSMELQGLWAIPDPSALLPDSVSMIDGWAATVELLGPDGYRAYHYDNPDAHPKWPSAKSVVAIVKALGPINALIAQRTGKRPQ